MQIDFIQITLLSQGMQCELESRVDWNIVNIVFVLIPDVQQKPKDWTSKIFTWSADIIRQNILLIKVKDCKLNNKGVN